MAWIVGKLGRHVSPDRYREALAAMDDATNQTRSLRQQLEPFRLERDPFAAVMHKQMLASIHQEKEWGGGG